jgi:signal transduction histidine kinase
LNHYFFIIKLTIFIGIIFFASTIFTVKAAEQFNEKQIKSAYIVNFIKHINWPNEKAKPHYRITIYKNRDFFQFFSTALQNKLINNKKIVVNYANTLSDITSSELLFVSSSSEETLYEVASHLRGRQTLLVSDNSINKHDIMINLIKQDNVGSITFEVNKSNIIYENLSISADLLLLGGSELDVAMLYRETEMAMQVTRDKSLKLQDDLALQEQKISGASKRLAASKEELRLLNVEYRRSAIAAEQQKTELEQLKKDVVRKQKSLSNQRLSLQEATKGLDDVKKELAAQQLKLAEKEVKSQKVLALVEKNNAVLIKQDAELAKHKLQLDAQEEELTSKKEIITSQRTYLLITSLLIVTALIALILVMILFIRNKKTTKKLAKTLAHLSETQDQLIQSEKMASLGSLVAGVAHEINTPLGISITANSLVLDDTIDIKNKIQTANLSRKQMDRYIEKSEQSLTMSEKGLDRVRILLENFKQVAADQMVMDEREIDIVTYISEVISTLSVEIKKHNISYEYNGLEKLTMHTLPGVFAQVLTNLVINSIVHGFDGRESGQIKIKVFLTTPANSSNQMVQVIYSDNGNGMDNKTLVNIFEPFYTTKRGSGSTGLGMNIVYNIINKQLKGDISVASTVNESTTITITLPLRL